MEFGFWADAVCGVAHLRTLACLRFSGRLLLAARGLGRQEQKQGRQTDRHTGLQASAGTQGRRRTNGWLFFRGPPLSLLECELAREKVQYSPGRAPGAGQAPDAMDMVHRALAGVNCTDDTDCPGPQICLLEVTWAPEDEWNHCACSPYYGYVHSFLSESDVVDSSPQTQLTLVHKMNVI